MFICLPIEILWSTWAFQDSTWRDNVLFLSPIETKSSEKREWINIEALWQTEAWPQRASSHWYPQLRIVLWQISRLNFFSFLFLFSPYWIQHPVIESRIRHYSQYWNTCLWMLRPISTLPVKIAWSSFEGWGFTIRGSVISIQIKFEICPDPGVPERDQTC